ncbi:MAG: LLM class flavin-dependent oxidoreductase [Pseudorhodoplanes sp.]|nr:Limonene 1,2-monooxygenase [Pseudorhodoplanes sp.]MBW7949741.1 LLM class flavin-dependent oxidoreductase [Pseudorhodoplanes sp.]MCL4710255.1 LLM class flavin-dependent oxidoreductase [Pseudorhodoplanes sp.]GIK79421.1 MAG: alkane 1-monooxygenase [Alphaproteobacteria bacterium]
MKLGFFTMPIHPLDKDWRQSLQEDREAFILADELGFTEGYVGEHVTDRAENITSCAMFIASLIDCTKRIRLGTGTVNMPNTHPATVAAQIAMLDHMLDGRFIFGISPGGLLSDAEVFGNLDADRNAMFLEAINQVLQIWTNDPPYNIKGRFWTISVERQFMPELGQGFLPRPLQRPHPPIVVTAVAPFSRGVTEAAARGWDPISANFLMPAWVRSHWPRYVEGCARAGRPADPANWRVAKSIFVADDDKTAKAYATAPNGPYRYYYSQLLTKLKHNGRIELFKTRRDQPDHEVTLDTVCDELVIHGSPDKVADDILAYREKVGDFGTLLYAGKDWADRELGRRSMVLLAEKVLPKVNAALQGNRTAAQ